MRKGLHPKQAQAEASQLAELTLDSCANAAEERATSRGEPKPYKPSLPHGEAPPGQKPFVPFEITSPPAPQPAAKIKGVGWRA
jgi:hypothetical protein